MSFKHISHPKTAYITRLLTLLGVKHHQFNTSVKKIKPDLLSELVFGDICTIFRALPRKHRVVTEVLLTDLLEFEYRLKPPDTANAALVGRVLEAARRNDAAKVR